MIVSDTLYNSQNFMQKVYSVYLVHEEPGKPREVSPGVTFTTGQHFGPDEEGTYMGGFVFNAMTSQTGDKTIHKSFENIELLPPYSGNSSKVLLKPGDQKVVVKKHVSLLEETGLTIAMAIMKPILR